MYFICFREIIGYVDSIEGRKQIRNYVLFKFVLTNGERKITCLIWGDQLINQYQAEITIGRVSPVYITIALIMMLFKNNIFTMVFLIRLLTWRDYNKFIIVYRLFTWMVQGVRLQS